MLYSKTPSSLNYLNKLQMSSYKEALKIFKNLFLGLEENVIDNNAITNSLT